MVKLVVCDIDNTLVPKHKHPSERTLACIHEFEKRGILFGFASGRSTKMLQDMAIEWGVHCDLLIGNNGGEYQDEITGEHDIMPKLTCDELKEIFEIMSPFREHTNTQMFIKGKKLVRRLDEQTLASSKYVAQSDIVVAKDDSEFYQEPAYKVGFRTEAQIMPEVEARTAEMTKGKNYKGFKTEYTMFEFCRIEANKGDMLYRFCKNHNIDIQDTMAFGDMTNDISILEAAGWGVCLENGSPDAKEAADEITELSIEDDGWADYVEKHILNK
ncbi:MAG: HAD-IIB family hydrolase [Bacillota bacterium]|nr:HAD-IIB family hydrolase [Bacillota bacterium]